MYLLHNNNNNNNNHVSCFDNLVSHVIKIYIYLNFLGYDVMS